MVECGRLESIDRLQPFAARAWRYSLMSKDKIDMMTLQNKTLAIIMGGGAGTRLFPLTQKRAKPAVPLGGKYRLVDIPISNCLNSGFRQVYILT